MKYIYLLSAFILSCMVSGCIEDPEMGTDIKNGKAPTLTICDREEFIITAKSVTLSGEIVSENGIPVIERGFCWGTSEEDMKTHLQKMDKGGKGKFETMIDNLKNKTPYIVCTYAIAANNGKSTTYYSDNITFTTNEGLGTVKNLEPEKIRATTAICGGLITAPGEGEIKEVGVYYSLTKSEKPSEKDTKCVGTLVKGSGEEKDSIVCTLAGLKPETPYYVRAYVENTYGVFYDLALTTLTTTDGYPVLKNLKKGDVRYTDAEFSATITDEGDAPITACGFCYGIKELPTIDDDMIICKSIDNEFTGTLVDLKSQTQYYVRAYATNKYGTSYNVEGPMELITKSNWPTVSTYAITEIVDGRAKVGGKVLDEGNSGIAIAGICWSIGGIPTVDPDSIQLNVNKDSTFTGTITKLKGGKTYNVRAFAKNNEKEYAYGPVMSFTTPAVFKTAASFIGDKRIIGSVGACSLDGTGYLLGGDLGQKCTNELWAFNEYYGWSPLNSFPGGERKWQTVVGNGSSLYVFGGVTSKGEVTKDFYAYSVNDNNWSRDLGTTNAPTFTSQVASTTIGKVLYYIGGRGLSSTDKDSLSNEVRTYSVSGWKPTTAFPEEQCGSIAVIINDKMYVGLGINNLTPLSSSKQLWSSSNADTWDSEESILGTASMIRAGVAYRNCLYVVDNNGKIWEYDPSSRKWTEKSQLPSSNRDIHCMYVLNDVIYIGLGSASTLVSYDPVWDN